MDTVLGLIVFGLMTFPTGRIFFQTIGTQILGRDGFMGEAVILMTIYTIQRLLFVAFTMHGVSQCVSRNGEV